MPTIRPRYQVTETPEVGHALDQAALRWPGETRAKLLQRLIGAGGAAIENDIKSDESAHRAAVERSSGRYPTAFGPGYLDDLRQDWPD